MQGFYSNHTTRVGYGYAGAICLPESQSNSGNVRSKQRTSQRTCAQIDSFKNCQRLVVSPGSITLHVAHFPQGCIAWWQNILRSIPTSSTGYLLVSRLRGDDFPFSAGGTIHHMLASVMLYSQFEVAQRIRTTLAVRCLIIVAEIHRCGILLRLPGEATHHKIRNQFRSMWVLSRVRFSIEQSSMIDYLDRQRRRVD